MPGTPKPLAKRAPEAVEAGRRFEALGPKSGLVERLPGSPSFETGQLPPAGGGAARSAFKLIGEQAQVEKELREAASFSLANLFHFGEVEEGPNATSGKGGLANLLGNSMTAAVIAGLATFLSPSDAEAATTALSRFADSGGGSGVALGIGLFALGMALWSGGGGKDPLPLWPRPDGLPFTVGRDPSNNLVLSENYISRRHFQIRWEPKGGGLGENQEGWILINGETGDSKTSLNSMLINGQSLQGKKWSPLRHGDVIELGDHRFVFQDPRPLAAAPAAARAAVKPPPGDWNDVKEFRDGIASASHKGIEYNDANEDRFVGVRLPNGKVVMAAIDGMGGIQGGARAAEVARVAMDQAIGEGKSGKEIIEAAHQAIVADNQGRGITKNPPGAVAMVVEIEPTPDGQYRAHFSQIGDADAVVIRLGASDPILYHTSRPNSYSIEARDKPGQPFRLLPDGRLARGQTLSLRMDPLANIVNKALGYNQEVIGGSPQVPLRSGDIVLAGSDGFFENFGSHNIISHIISQSGARSPSQIRDALMQEALIRQSLLARSADQPITHDTYTAAYREVTGQEPPSGWSGMYEGWRDASGVQYRYFLKSDGSVYEHRFDASGKALGNRVVDHFKQDNVTLMVHVVGQ